MSNIASKTFSIRYVLMATNRSWDGKDYKFFAGVPVDLRNKKYNRYRHIFESGLFHCQMCGAKASVFKLRGCRGSGSIHKSGARKHYFKLYNERGVEMTLDHWIPKSFLKRKNLFYKASKNLVMMCTDCNKFKADLVPHNWKDCYRRMELNYQPA